MTKKAIRYKGEGSMRQHENGSYEIRLTLVDPVTKKAYRKSVTSKDKDEAIRKATALKRNNDLGTLQQKGQLLSEYMVLWLDEKALELGPRTLANYKIDMERYLSPHLKGVHLGELDPRQVKSLQLKLAKAHTNYVANRAMSLLKTIFNDALAQSLITRNPVSALKALRHHKKEIEILSAEDIRKFLDDAKQMTRLHNFFYVLLVTGMRPAEAIGLKWPNVKFYDAPKGDAGEITINSAIVRAGGNSFDSVPKTRNAYRTLGFSHETKAVLLDQKALLMADATIAGYQRNNYVFPSELGTLLGNTSINRAIKATAKRIGLDPAKISAYTFRHTFASMLISQQVDPVKLADMMGHSSPKFTLDVYAHLFKRRNRPPMPSLTEILGEGENSKKD